MPKIQKILCEVCGRQFTPYRNTSKYCSNKCRRKAIVRFHERLKNTPEEKKCQHCGKPFVTVMTHKIYCCDECYREHKRQEYTKKKGTERTCPVCLTKFISAHVNKKYCSSECYRRAHTARQDKEYIDARTELR